MPARQLTEDRTACQRRALCPFAPAPSAPLPQRPLPQRAPAPSAPFPQSTEGRLKTLRRPSAEPADAALWSHPLLLLASCVIQLQGDEALTELRSLAAAPALERLREQLQRFAAGAGGSTDRSALGGGERELQGIFLAFMRELLATTTQPILRLSGDAADAARAEQCSVACELAADVLWTTADVADATIVTKRVLMCRADALARICGAPPRTPTGAFLHAAYESRTVREFLLAPPPTRGAGAGGGKLGGAPSGTGKQGSFADASWMASGLDAGQSIAEHAMALDAVQLQIEQQLAHACPALLKGGFLSPRTANFRMRFELGVNETLLAAIPCALHDGRGLRQGVLHASSHHLCFEAPLFAAAFTKLPLTRVVALEPCRDPLFHLIPNALRIDLSDGPPLTFASFAARDEALALLRSCVAAEAPGAAAPEALALK